MTKKDKNKDNKKDKIIKIVLIIIIVLLLIRNCSLIREKNNNKMNIIDINCSSNKCQQLNDIPVNCLLDNNNNKCTIPNFVGETKKDVLKWLSSISNTIDIEIVTVENSEYKDGYVLEQSISNISVKELINNKTKLVITIVNNGSLIDCQKDSKNSKCVLQNFTGKTKNDVEDWLDSFSNNIKVKYAYVSSNNKAGTIINQSIKSGTSIKSILDKDETIIIYISTGDTVVYSDSITNNGNNNTNNNSNTNNNTDNDSSSEETPEDVLDDDFYVSDREKIKWEEETSLNIFEDSQNISKVRGKIAPESTGIYKFKVNNGTSNKLNYKITFSEVNSNNINMKFKLKKGDTYLIDHYVSYDELNLFNIILNSRSSDTYSLEWKWVGDNDENDTQIGMNARNRDITYDLKIYIEVESV